MKIKQIVFNFIPILLLFILLSYTEQFIQVSGSVLGKLLAVVIVLFYSSIDILHGILAAGFVILYYQSDIVEAMLDRYEYPTVPTQPDTDTVSVTVPIEDTGLLATDNTLSYLSQYERPKTCKGGSNNNKMTFRKEHCKKGHLTVKDQIVRTEMTEHIYPEVSFVSDRCNICDSTCDFKVTNSMITTSSKEGFAPISCRR